MNQMQLTWLHLSTRNSSVNIITSHLKRVHWVIKIHELLPIPICSLKPPPDLIGYKMQVLVLYSNHPLLSMIFYDTEINLIENTCIRCTKGQTIAFPHYDQTPHIRILGAGGANEMVHHAMIYIAPHIRI